MIINGIFNVYLLLFNEDLIYVSFNNASAVDGIQLNEIVIIILVNLPRLSFFIIRGECNVSIVF